MCKECPSCKLSMNKGNDKLFRYWKKLRMYAYDLS